MTAFMRVQMCRVDAGGPRKSYPVGESVMPADGTFAARSAA